MIVLYETCSITSCDLRVTFIFLSNFINRLEPLLSIVSYIINNPFILYSYKRIKFRLCTKNFKSYFSITRVAKTTKKKTVVVFVKTFNYQPTKTWEVFKKKKHWKIRGNVTKMELQPLARNNWEMEQSNNRTLTRPFFSFFYSGITSRGREGKKGKKGKYRAILNGHLLKVLRRATRFPRVIPIIVIMHGLFKSFKDNY